MDYEMFLKAVEDVYKEVTSPYSLQEVQNVFVYFFRKYERETGAPHPPLKREQIKRIIEDMPYTGRVEKTVGLADIDPDSYPVMIDKYFETKFPRYTCDYRINHFFSGRIREMRYLEELY